MGKEEKGKAFSDRLFGTTWHNGILIVIVTLWACLGLTKIIIGGIYIDDCSEEEMMPVWLIIDAIIPVFFVIGFVLHLKKGNSDGLKLYGLVSLIIGMVLSIGWSICGAVWIYKNWNTDNGDCESVVEIFAFAMLTFNWTVMWMWCTLCLRLLCCYFCKPKVDKVLTANSMDPDETARMRRLIGIHAGRKRTRYVFSCRES